jgi:hypothetical protein
MRKMSHLMNGFAATVLVVGFAASVGAVDQNQRQDAERRVIASLGAQPQPRTAQTGRPPQQFLAQFDPSKRPPGKLDAPEQKKTPPFNYQVPPQQPSPKVPHTVTYPCPIKDPATGKQHMGVCVRTTF